MPSTRYLEVSYLDTSYLLKSYLLEYHSDEVTKYIRTPGPTLLVSLLTDVEMASALSRRLPPTEARKTFELYRKDRTTDLFTEVSMTPQVYALGQDLALKLGSRFLLRSLDIVHLAIAKQYGATHLATYDGRLATAADYVGLSIVGARP